ncbi:MAG: DUF1559 domain-containing protein [Planctomycetes bacterium]|nr:DUF1559 domain-containing protein [Planctomycetota bacterium]
MEHPKRRRAFTQIEVLVVVAIIAVLVAILMPSLRQAREMTRMSICKSNVKQVVLGMHYYITEYKVLPATQSTFFLNNLYWGNGWWGNLRTDESQRLNWVWDGACNRTSTSGGGYKEADLPKFRADCPQRGTIFKYIRNPKTYLCPSEQQGPPTDTPLGGGGNGRSSYSMSAYIGYKAPEKMIRPPCPLTTGYLLHDPDAVPRDIYVKTRLVWSPAQMFLVVEEHPYWNMGLNREGNFNYSDRIVTRHLPGFNGPEPAKTSKGRTVIGYVDGHVDSPLYSWYTTGYRLYREIGFPGEDDDFMKLFLPRLPNR